MKIFMNSAKCWICDNDYIDNDVKIRDHCHITGKYRGSVHRLNQKNIVVYHNLQKHDSHLIMQELGKLKLKINVTLNGLEKCMSFTTNNKLSFIGTSQFLSSSLESLVKI